jgi:hypothetical protein
MMVGILMGCTAPDPRRTSASYDLFTQKLVQIEADRDGDGRIDQWSYLDGNRPLRGEADTDGDGRIDRWEYFDETAALQKVGTSSANDGIEDTWTWTVVTGGEGRIDHARKRDRHVDRSEYFNGTTLVRAEEDTNGDGKVDRWDRYENAILRQAEFDTTLAAGRPNRRILYDASGRFVRVEGDPEFDGTFVTMHGLTPEDVRRGLTK